jgi:hypothetical protein
LSSSDRKQGFAHRLHSRCTQGCWTDISGTEIRNNDTYRSIVDFAAVGKRYYRLVIYSQNALQAQITEIIPYVMAKPPIPQVPDDDYVLIVGNQMNGFTYTQLAKFLERNGYKSVTVPHHEMSLDVLRALQNEPMAIIFSGNNADWQYLPLFEFYGEWEIIRVVDDISMMGIRAGNSLAAMLSWWALVPSIWRSGAWFASLSA